MKQKGEGITGLASTALYEKVALLATPFLEFEACKFFHRYTMIEDKIMYLNVSDGNWIQLPIPPFYASDVDSRAVQLFVEVLHFAS